VIRVARVVLALIVLAGSSALAQRVEPKGEIQDWFDLLQAAVKRRDRAAIERLYAPEFVFALGNTGVVSRKQQIDGLMVLDAAKSTLSETNLNGLRFYGDVAQLRIQTGTVFSVSTFVKRAGRWQIVLTQTNLIPQPAPAPPQTKKP
jgi:hypothetical protein